MILNYLFQKTHVPLTEDEFVDEVQNSGVLVYLSATWLRELYQQVLANDLLRDVTTSEHPLIHLLSGTHFLFEFNIVSRQSRVGRGNLGTPISLRHFRFLLNS